MRLDAQTVTRRVAPSKGDTGDRPYKPFKARAPKAKELGILTRLSGRWYREWESEETTIPVPYIDKVGKFTTTRLGVWRTTPETWFASTCSTVYNRLLGLLKKRSGRKMINKSYKEIISKFAIYHTYHQSDYVYDRMLANLRLGRLKVLHALYAKYSRHTDDNYRFVYSQASTVAHWLSFQSLRICDKSKVKIEKQWIFYDHLEQFEHMFKEYPEGDRRSFKHCNPFIFPSHRYCKTVVKEDEQDSVSDEAHEGSSYIDVGTTLIEKLLATSARLRARRTRT